MMYVPNDAMRWCTAWAGGGAEQAMCVCWWNTGSKELPVAPRGPPRGPVAPLVEERQRASRSYSDEGML